MIRDEIHQTEDTEVKRRKPKRWMSCTSLRRILKETKGQAFAIVALSLPVLVGGAAIAVDVGHMYVAKSVMQNAVDAGSRAGASVLAEGGSQADANTAATSYALENLSTYSYVANVEPTVTFPTSDSVNVTITHAVPLFFAPVFGIDTADVSSVATAGLSNVSSVEPNTLVPLAIYCNNESGCSGSLSVDQNLTLRRYCGNFFADGPSGNGCGNAIADGENFFVGLTFDNSNSNAQFRSDVLDGYSGTVTLGQTARALPGNRNGWRDGMTDRLADGRNEVVVPIIEKLEPVSGTFNIQIVDFVKVDISSFAISGNTDTTTLQIIRGAVSATEFADTDQGLGINSVVGVRLSQ